MTRARGLGQLPKHLRVTLAALRGIEESYPMKKGLRHNLVLVVTPLALDYLVPLDDKALAAEVGFRCSALDGG
jgi:hypothetical protein